MIRNTISALLLFIPLMAVAQDSVEILNSTLKKPDCPDIPFYTPVCTYKDKVTQIQEKLPNYMTDCRNPEDDSTCVTVMYESNYVEGADARGYDLRISIFENKRLDSPVMHFPSKLVQSPYNEAENLKVSVGDLIIECSYLKR